MQKPYAMHRFIGPSAPKLTHTIPRRPSFLEQYFLEIPSASGANAGDALFECLPDRGVVEAYPATRSGRARADRCGGGSGGIRSTYLPFMVHTSRSRPPTTEGMARI